VAAVLREVALAGFDHVDLTDSWLRPGDLLPDRLENLVRALKDNGLGVTAISSVRKSVINPDPEVSANHLAYTFRTSMRLMSSVRRHCQSGCIDR
jgi:sugar phosphate isomerase/epimerase